MYKSLVLTSLLFSTSLAHAVSLQITNASFETPILQNGASVSSTGGQFYSWTVYVLGLPGDGQVQITNPSPALAGPVLDGSNVAIVRPGTILYQAFDGSQLTNADSFRFSLDLSHLTRPGCCSDWGISLSWSENSISKSISIIDVNSDIIFAEDQITHYEFDTQLPSHFLPDNGLVTLGIFNAGASSRELLVDNFAIDVTPVPVPAAAWLFLTGLATIAGLRLRKIRRK